ncbi:MAG: PAS domain S-box protein [Anaerolineae bacterium]|jgi:PAS domain S-box-containing protein
MEFSPKIYQAIVENMSEAVYVCDLDRNILYVNPAFERLSGWPLQQALGEKCYTVLGQNQTCEHACPVEKSISEKLAILHHEGQLKTPSGEVRDLQTSISPLYKGEMVAGAIVVIKDVTHLDVEQTHVKTLMALEQEIEQRRMVEDELRESEERFAVFMDHLPAPVFIKDQGGRVLYVNQCLKDLFDAQTWLDQNTTARFPQGIAQAMTADDRKVLDEGPIIVIESAPDKYGVEHVYQTIKFPIRREGQAPLLGGIALDVTEQMRVENALRRERDFAESLVETAQAIVLVLDPEGRIVRFNPYMEEVSGYYLDEVQGQDWFTTFLPQRDRAAVQELFRRAMSEIQTRGNVNPIVTKDGRKREIEWYDKTLKDVVGNTIGLLVVGQDITERVRTEESLRKHAERLSILHEIDQAILGAQSPEAIAQAVLQRVGRLVSFTNAAITMFDFETHEAFVLALHHKTQGGSPSGETRLSLAGLEDVIQWLRRGKVQVVDDVQNLVPRPLPALQTLMEAAGMRSYVSAPMIVKGELVGSLNLGSDGVAAFTPEHAEVARELAAQLAIALQQARLHEQVERHAGHLERRVADRTRELQTLYNVTAVASESLNLEVVLEQSLKQSLAATRCQAGVIQLLDEAGGTAEGEILRLIAEYGLPPRVKELIAVLPSGGSAWSSWVVEHGKSLMIPDMSVDPRTPHTARAGLSFSYLGVPMRIRGEVIGALGVLGSVGQQFSTEEVALLASIADHVAVAVDNARLRRQAEQAAVVGERARLARELHDSVTQSLYSLTLFAEAGREFAKAEEWKRVEQHLAWIGETTQQSLKEMRLLVYELRPPALEREGLVGALHQRLEAVEGRTGVKARLVAEELVELPARVQKGLYRIAQEALNNALKHAEATSVVVRLRAEGEGATRQVSLEVVDDGIGFDPEAVSDKGGLGLISMRERAENLAGEFAVLAAPGKGTKIQVVIGAG